MVTYNTPNMRDMYNCYCQAGSWASGSILPKHKREADDDYARRMASFQSPAVYTHLINTYDCLWSKDPSRADASDLYLNNFVYSAGYGESLNSIVNRALKMSMVLGSSFIVMDSFIEQPETMEEMISGRTYPFIELIKPYDVTELVIDRIGNITKFSYTYTEDNVSYTRTYEPYTVTDTPNHDNDLKIIGVVSYNLSVKMPVIPVVASSQQLVSDELPSSPTTGLYQQQRSLAITNSYIDEEFVANCFPLLVIKSASSPDKIKLGNNNGIHLSVGEDAIWLQPSTSTIDSKLKRIEQLMTTMVRTHANLISSGDTQSGVAKLLDRSVGASYLSSLSGYLEKIEYQIYEMFCEFSNEVPNPDYKVSYTKDFNFTTIAEQIATTADLLSLDFSDETKLAIKKILLQNVVTNDDLLLADLMVAESQNETTESAIDSVV